MLVKTDLHAGEITLYGTEWCSWTQKQRQYLDGKGLQYSFVNCDKQSCPDFVNGYPTLVMDGQVIHGFKEV